MNEIQDKINIQQKINSGEIINIELGGGRKSKEGIINIDALDLPEVDIVANLENGLNFIPDNSVDNVSCISFLEHIDNFEFLMKEVFRVLKNGKEFEIFVPHFSNPYYYSDYTHKRFFGYYSFYYFSKDQSKIKRNVPIFYNDIDFEIVSQDFTFSSVFRGVHKLKKIIGKVINSSVLFQEVYEGLFSWLFTAYGLKVRLVVKKKNNIISQ
jgi:SAM-dependent methyltransferase